MRRLVDLWWTCLKLVHIDPAIRLDGWQELYLTSRSQPLSWDNDRSYQCDFDFRWDLGAAEPFAFHTAGDQHVKKLKGMHMIMGMHMAIRYRQYRPSLSSSIHYAHPLSICSFPEELSCCDSQIVCTINVTKGKWKVILPCLVIPEIRFVSIIR